MSVRFVIGRAGTGKTHHCLEAIRGRLRQEPVDGGRLIFLVPEQASQQMERSLLLPGRGATQEEGLSASHRAEVLSFQRLALRVMEAIGSAVPTALSEAARTMVLRHLMTENADRLGYYRRPERWCGVAAKLSRTITELIQEGVAPDALIAGPSPNAPESEAPAQDAKLADLATLYAAYLRFLDRGFVDPSQYLRVARGRFGRCEWLAGAEVWVDGFASMSGEEAQTIVALARLSSHTEITALLDPQRVTTLSHHPEPMGASALFDRTLRTYGELRELLVTAGLAVDDPLLLEPPTPPRFRANGSLALVERNWSVRSAPTGDAPPARLELVQLPSRRVEVDYAVSRICQWISAPGGSYRYRDLAIIARDLEPYQELLGAALESRGIPFFMDRRRPVAHHPLVEWIRASVAVAEEDFSLDSIRLLLKTGLSPLTDAAADELENYLLAHGLAGTATWMGDDWTFRRRDELTESQSEVKPLDTTMLERVNASRRQLVQNLHGFLMFARQPGPHTGADWTKGLVTWLGELGVAAKLSQWTAEAEADGKFDESEEHRQVWGEVFSFLDDLAFAFSCTPLSLAEFAGVLDAGLSEFTLGLVPPTLDQLLVGAIERSRHPDIKAAVVLGFNDGLFPKRLTEDAILNDDDRVRLRDAGVRLMPPVRESVADESMLAYIALTRASESLVVTFAAADENGKSLAASPYVRTLCEAHPGLVVTEVADPVRTRDTWDVWAPTDLRRRLAMEFRSRPALSEDKPGVRGRWNELYDSVRSDLARQPASRRALEGLAQSAAESLSADSVRRVFSDPMRTSISQLESFAACPFQHFAKYVLRLKERADAAIEALDVGQIHHAILEDFALHLAEKGSGWSDVSEGDVFDHLGESCERVSAKLPTGGVLADSRNAYVLRRSALGLARVLRAQRRYGHGSSARPRAAELAFGFEEKGSLPALELRTPTGRRIRLRGYLDRVDLIESAGQVLGIVLDYKNAREKQLDLLRAYHGLALQLPAYLLVLSEHAEKLAGRKVQPAAAVYVPLGPRYESVDHPSDLTESQRRSAGVSKLRGVLHADHVNAIDPQLETGSSEFFNVRRKVDGGIADPGRSDAAQGDAFHAILAHARKKLGELADQILTGEAAVAPYRLKTFSPCSWCTLQKTCRFEFGLNQPRFLDPLARSEVLDRLRSGPEQSRPHLGGSLGE